MSARFIRRSLGWLFAALWILQSEAHAQSFDGECRKITDRYRALADADPRKSPLTKLSESQASKIALFPDQIVDLEKWREVQGIVVSKELRKAWDDLALMGQGGTSLTTIPGLNVYAASGAAGTGHFVSTVYFAVRDRVAYPAKAPQEFEESVPGVARSLGRIDDTPAAFEEDYDNTPRMTSTLKVATWKRDQFSAICDLTFAFAPVFTRDTLNTWEESCQGSDCDGLRQAAFEIVAAVQKSPRTARSQLLAGLSPEQRAAYDGADADGSDEQDPATFTVESPFRLPYAHERRVYIVSVGHQTIGWRYFADWGVKFESVDDGRTVTFAVGMWKGPLTGISIEPHSWRDVDEAR